LPSPAPRIAAAAVARVVNNVDVVVVATQRANPSG
jgi:hypothetical protein